MTDDLAQFLHARIAEDEEVARTATGTTDGRWVKPDEWTSRAASAGMKPPQIDHLVRHDPARVLAECDAKRRIVEEMSHDDFGRSVWTLKMLALPYADHPGWREEWKP